MDSAPRLPFLTAQLPGCGGRVKARPEDFVVEELPAYEPAGSGEHLYLWVEKRGITTRELVRRAGHALGLRARQIGYAGRKDAQAVTRQWISLHTPHDTGLAALESPTVRVLNVMRHGNKLRLGHLRGNRFRILLRGARPPARFGTLVEALTASGFPNYFGPQRFGADGSNAAEGALLLREGGFARGDPEHARFLTNAYQSALFNLLVARRLRALGGLDGMLEGDLAVFRESGSFFPVTAEELDAAQARAAAGEISASAPLFGHKVPLAEGVPGEWERELLAAEGMALEDFRGASKRRSLKGERRPVRAFPGEPAWRSLDDDGEPCLELVFSLRPGIYATSLLREITKDEGLARPFDPARLPSETGAAHAR